MLVSCHSGKEALVVVRAGKFVNYLNDLVSKDV
jgi:hypothetical protein